MRSEVLFQLKLIDKLQEMFPLAFVIKLPPDEVQGIPDLLILYGDRWAMLECKKSATAEVRPNQPYYVDMFNKMSFAAFIFPENEEQVLNELQSAFGDSRETRVSQPQ